MMNLTLCESCFNFSKADLIWNETTREEFRRSIEDEMRILEQEKEIAPMNVPISWNHTEFQVFIFLTIYFYFIVT